MHMLKVLDKTSWVCNDLSTRQMTAFACGLGTRRLVLLAHDESTMQANDGEKCWNLRIVLSIVTCGNFRVWVLDRSFSVFYSPSPIFKVLIMYWPNGIYLFIAWDLRLACIGKFNRKARWGPEGEQPILKKGAGWGEHQSDVICSTFTLLKDAGEQMEYGKNYDGIGMVGNLLSSWKSVLLPRSYEP